jgi:gamma-glutamyltranspeptidase/glutathione hydrolase
MPDPAHGGAYAVASPHADATEAGRAAFAAGGNAVDAALAAACALTVVYPHMCAVGGDIMALVHDGEAHTINASGRAPAAAPAGGDVPERGVGAITVPGAVSGWHGLAERWGSRPASAAIEAAAELAEAGVPVARSLAGALEYEPDLVAADAGMRGVFMRDGHVLRMGDMLVQPALGATLRRLAENGADELYRGETGARMVAGLTALGCRITEADLAAHRADIEPALHRTIGDLDLHTMGANSQGFCLLQILAAVAHLGLADPLGAGAPMLASIFRESARDRDAHLADPAAMRRPVDTLLTPEHIADLAGRATALAARPEMTTPAHGDTIAVVAADANGLSVSLIQSIFSGFGSGVLEPETGILLHNRGACFSSDSASPNALGPGKRPLHTLMPLVGTQDGRATWVAGTMGGRAQAQIHAQMLLRRAAGADVATAVSAPRMIVGDLELGGRGVAVEQDFTTARDAFGRAGIEPDVMPRLSESAGHAHAIVPAEDGRFEAASDPRSDGAAICS